MKIITTIKGVDIQVFSAPREAPIERFNELQKYMIIESGIGHTTEAIDAHYLRTATFIQNDDKASALKEIENNRYALVSAMSSINYASLSFSCMVLKVGDIECKDVTLEGLQRTGELLKESEITMQQVVDEIEEFKKKL